MRIINLSLLLLILPIWANCQLVYDAETYKKVVRDFYDHVFHKKFSSLKDYSAFFGPHSEDEEVLFFKKCDNGKLTPECVKKARERNSTWSSHESLIFLELKKVKQEIATEDNMTEVLRKMKLVDNGIPDAIDVELDFPNNCKIVFAINNVKGEPPIILDLYQKNGASIFNAIGTRISPAYYKRLAKINDPDGYTNVRSGKSHSYSVKWKVGVDDIFFVYPNCNESWWEIENLNCERGYINRTRIILFGTLSEKKRISLADTVLTIYSQPLCK